MLILTRAEGPGYAKYASIESIAARIIAVRLLNPRRLGLPAILLSLGGGKFGRFLDCATPDQAAPNALES